MVPKTVDQKIAESENRQDRRLADAVADLREESRDSEGRIIKTLTGVVRAEVAATGLNGEREAILELAAATPALLRLVAVAEEVIANTNRDRSDREWWDGLRARLHWNSWVGPAFKGLLVAVAGALAWQEAARIFGHQLLWP